MQFIDEAVIRVKAGDGGNGAVAFRREDKVAHGGPSGGDGGDGGDIVVIADPQLGSLLDFKYRRVYAAEPGEHGRNKDQYGAAGEDLILRVPVGTVIYEGDTQLVDLATPNERYVLARGGRGGRGNMHFATPWNQAPRTAEPGTPGEAREVKLSLKLLADVGLLGKPNVGKSTFISHVSRARPKIADYPFTTLVPSLGVVRLSDERQFVIADIPGLIEGASEGAGLGHQFLRHVERCRVLLHIVEDVSYFGGDAPRTPLDDFHAINAELAGYAPDLATKPQVVALNKIDTLAPEAVAAHVRAFGEEGVELRTMSAATGEGVAAILEALWKHLHA